MTTGFVFSWNPGEYPPTHLNKYISGDKISELGKIDILLNPKDRSIYIKSLG